ncbi:MAG: DUF4870 domain-containing protein [Candidatus Woesearchaeota archaeon]
MSRHKDSKICAILAYLLIGIIWYFADEKMRKDAFAKFHVKQALLLLTTGVILSVVVMILSGILMVVPFVGMAVSMILGMVVNITLLVLWIMGLVNAANEKKKRLPIIGSFAEKVFNF